MLIQEVTAGDTVALGEAIKLLDAYVAWLGVSWCFQDLAAERADPLSRFRAPGGGLWLARLGDAAVGLVALRELGPGRAEIKRLFVEPASRGRGVAHRLVATALGRATAYGYDEVVLDTIPDRMKRAVRLYQALGFEPCPPYYPDPPPDLRFYRLRLSGAA